MGGKLGVKLKGGMYVVGFDMPEVQEFGWKLHDEIVEVNGRPVTDRDSFAKEYTQAKKKLPMTFVVLRNDAKTKKRRDSTAKVDGTQSSNPKVIVQGAKETAKK